MKTKFAKKFLDFCNRLTTFAATANEMAEEIQGIEGITSEENLKNFSSTRCFAKLRKFSEKLDVAGKTAEELSDDLEDISQIKTEGEDADKLNRKANILKKLFSAVTKELNEIKADVADISDDASTEETQVEKTEKTEEEKKEETANNEEKTEITNFSKSNYLVTKMRNLCTKFKNFSESVEDTGDIIDEITDEVTVEAEPTNEATEAGAEAATEKTQEEQQKTEVKSEEENKEEITMNNEDKLAESVEGLADDVVAGQFDEEAANKEVEETIKENANFSKKALLSVIKSFAKVVKHFSEATQKTQTGAEVEKTAESVPVVNKKDLTTKEAEALVSECKNFSKTSGKDFSKRLTRKLANFSEVCEQCADGDASTDKVLESAQEVVDTIKNDETASAEQKTFAENLEKVIDEVNAPAATEEVKKEEIPAEVVEQDAKMNSTISDMDKKIDELELNPAVTSFAKMSSKSLSSIKCFTQADVDNKLGLLENFTESFKNLCSLKNFTEEKPAEEIKNEETQTQTEKTEEEKKAEEEAKKAEEEKAAQEAANKGTQTEKTEVENNEEQKTEKTEEENKEEKNEVVPSDSEVVLKNFSKTQKQNSSYGDMMAKLANLH